MPDRPPNSAPEGCSLLVYGSLMHPQERDRAGLATDRAVPVRAAGLTREFSQRPSWRRGSGKARAVLTVRPLTDGTINAVLLSGLPAATLNRLDQRERGYVRRQLDPGRLLTDNDDSTLSGDHIFYYEGRPEFRDVTLQPNPDYLALCLSAASSWGEAFHQTFLQTTFVAGQPLSVTDGVSGNDYER